MKNLLLLIFICINFNSYAVLDKTQYIIVKELNDEWLVYSKKYNAYVYYLNSVNSNTNIINQWIHVEKYKNYLLSFEARKGLGLFVNNRLVYKNTSDSTVQVYFEISKFSEYQPRGKALITLYNPSNNLPFNKTYIVSKANVIPKDQIANNILIKKRSYKASLNPYVIVFLIILLLLAILKHKFNRRFEEFLGLRNTLANTWLEEMANLNLASFPLIIIIYINALCLSYITAITGGIYSVFNLLFLNIPAGVLNQIIICSVIFTAIFFLKYFFLLFVGWIFNLYKIINIQFFEFIKGFLKVNILMVLLTSFIITWKNTLYVPVLDFLSYTLVFVLVLVTIRTAYLIFKIGAYRNIYLFSYLCTTELIPLTFIIKIILFRNN